MIDVSDGVAADALHLAEESSLGLALHAGNVPLAPGVAEVAASIGVSAHDLALAGGEDYELLIAVHPHDVDLMREVLEPTPLAVVGEFDDSDRRVIVWPDGSTSPLAGRGWNHFA